jgi:hypothetical protein
MLKNKTYAWYLCSGVIFTKNNLAMRNWQESKACVFCPQDVTIKHIFFQCNFARSIWSMMQAALGLYSSTNVANIFRNWLYGIDHKYIIFLRMAAIALIIWSLWLCRNKVFNNKNSSLLQVIYQCMGTLPLWLPLQDMEVHNLFTEVCTCLEDNARDLFSRHGW